MLESFFDHLFNRIFWKHRKLDTNNNQICILVYFKINLYLNNSYILTKKNLLSQSIPSDIKKYHELCTMVSLKHLIEVPARVTVSSSTIIDHILASFPKIYWQVSQQGVIDVELSDHQLIYFIIKKSVHKQIR